MSNNTKVTENNTFFGKASITTGVVLGFILLNEVVQLVPTHKTKLQGILILLPLAIAPIGIILGFLSVRKSTDILAKWGVILNVILFLCPFLYMIFGTLIFGV